ENAVAKLPSDQYPGWSARAADGEPGLHVETDLAVGPDVLPEQRGQPAPVGGSEHGRPLLLGQGVLQHEGADVDEGGLEDAQAQGGHLDFLVPVGGDLAVAAVADDGIGAVPRLDDVEAFLDLPLQVTVPEVPCYEDRPLGAANLQHRLVGRVRRRPGEP